MKGQYFINGARVGAHDASTFASPQMPSASTAQAPLCLPGGTCSGQGQGTGANTTDCAPAAKASSKSLYRLGLHLQDSMQAKPRPVTHSAVRRQSMQVGTNSGGAPLRQACLSFCVYIFGGFQSYAHGFKRSAVVQSSAPIT